MRGIGVRALLLLAVPPAFIAGCDKCTRIESRDPFAKARCRIERLMEEKNIASFQAAVAKDGRIIYEEAFGKADVERGIRTTTRTMHLVASIAKPFASTAVMMLAERGKLDLQAPVNDYLGGAKLIACRGNAADATIARLLMHTTGLPYGYYICGDEVPAEKRRTNRDLLELAGVLAAAPGTRYQYTNIGYGLLEEIVRKASGRNMKDFIQEEIIAPLGLAHTQFFRSRPPPDVIATQNVPGCVLPIAFDADGYTALYSTAGDLARFGMFHLKVHPHGGEGILADSSLDLLWRYREEGVEGSSRRLAWDVQRDFGFETVQHGGGGPGLHNWLYMIPSENLVIAILSNAQYGNEASDPVLIELISAALSDSARQKFRPETGRGYPQKTRLNPAEFVGTWSGFIRGPKGECAVSLMFDRKGRPELRMHGKEKSDAEWIAPSGDVAKGHKLLLWRFDACIPYLAPFAPHDEVILAIWPEEGKLIGSAAAAKEKRFGKGENYVLPQYIELARSRE